MLLQRFFLADWRVFFNEQAFSLIQVGVIWEIGDDASILSPWRKTAIEFLAYKRQRRDSTIWRHNWTMGSKLPWTLCHILPPFPKKGTLLLSPWKPQVDMGQLLLLLDIWKCSSLWVSCGASSVWNYSSYPGSAGLYLSTSWSFILWVSVGQTRGQAKERYSGLPPSGPHHLAGFCTCPFPRKNGQNLIVRGGSGWLLRRN